MKMLFKHISYDDLSFVQAFFVGFQVEGDTRVYDCLPDAHEAASLASRADGVVDPITVRGTAVLGKFEKPLVQRGPVEVAVSRWHNGDPIGFAMLGRVEQGKPRCTEWMGSMQVLIPPGFIGARGGDPPADDVEEALRETFLDATISVGYRDDINEPHVSLVWTDGSDVQCRAVAWMQSSLTGLSYREVFQREYTALAMRVLRRLRAPHLVQT